MSNSFTTVTNTGCMSRIFGSIAGVFIGPILIIGAIWLLSWNEGRAVQAIVGTSQAAKAVVEVSGDAVNAANEGKLVHLVAPATAAGPIKDEDLNLSFADQVAVARTAEMYEWKEKKTETSHDKLGGGKETVTTYDYDRVWSSDAIDSKDFKHPEGHENPEMKVKSQSYTASDAKVAGYVLDDKTTAMLTLTTPLKPDAPEGWTVDGDKFLNGDKAEPKIGDERVSYKGLASGTTISVMAQQSKDGFAPFTTANGYSIQMAAVGNQPASQMIADRKSAEATMTWLLRVGGFFLMFVGFALLLGPLSAMAAIIPFMGSLVRGAAALAAIVISIPLTLIVIALSWVAFRPVVGIGLIVLAVVLGAALWFWHKRRPNPAHVAAVTPPA
jgi:hypothetical protein